ncbi:hypothetical protein HZB07_02715 [Candidatus Saganbacteria bacterium]|nr:hypothetical protein [Candidatus Saganbacteria bacterium]
MGKIIKILAGVVLVALGAGTIYLWWGELLLLIKGSIGLLLILAGLVAFALAMD